MRRLALAPLVLAVAFLAPSQALPIHDPDDGWPQGSRALENVATYAMAFPGRVGDTPTMEAARDELAARLSALGLVVERHRYAGNNPGTNIVGILPGTTRPHDWVVVSAHYDIALSPLGGVGAATHGAWDDGSGVAVVLEMARVAMTRPWENTVAFVLFDDEEGGLIGAGRFATEYNGRVWNGAPIRLVANLNTDPPGLNWPCVVEGVALPVTLMQWRLDGAGRTIVRDLAFAARAAEGVPDEAFEFFAGPIPIAPAVTGVSDNVAFANRGVPEIYVGSSMHLRVAGTPLPTVYPFHTPADDLATMLAYCGGNPLTLARALEVEMRILWRVLLGIDGHGGAFPTP